MTIDDPRTDELNANEPLDALLDPRARPRSGRERVDEREFAGGIPQVRAHIPSFRLGRRWVNCLWLALLGCVGIVIAVLVARQLRQYGWMPAFPLGCGGSTSSTSFS